MSNNPNKPDISDGDIAMLGLLAQTGQAKGPAPDDTELRAYLDGSLNSSRLDEIKSHIAHDPDIADKVLELAESASTVIDSSDRFEKRRFANKTTMFAGVAALAASLLVAVVMVRPTGDTPDTDNVRVVRSGPDLVSDRQQELAAIRLGYASGSNASGFSGVGNAFVAVCAAGCSERQKLRHYGALLYELEKVCLDSTAPRVTRQARTALDALVTGPGAISSSPWREYVSDLKRAVDQSDAALCRVATQMTKVLKNG